MALSNKQKQEWAKLLYTKDSITQKEIAKKVGVTEATVSKWIKAANWDVLASNYIITKKEELIRIYAQIKEMNDDINQKAVGKRYASSKEADALSKLATTAKNLEVETSIASIIDVSIGICEFIKELDFNKHKEFVAIIDQYISYKLAKK